MQNSSFFSNVNTDFQPNAPILNVNLLRNQAHSYGSIFAKNIEDTLKYAYGETYISKINVPQNMYYVIMDMENPFAESKESFSSVLSIQ